MTEPFLGELRIMSFDFPPKGWAFCNGQLLPINQNQALFSLLGTTYGGDGRINFGLPDLRGRVPVHMGSGFTLGQRGGEEAHTVNQSEMPLHVHGLNAKNADADVAAAATPPGPTVALAQAYAVLAGNPPPHVPVSLYSTGPADGSQTFLNTAISTVGGSQPHENRQPFLVLSVCIALQGIFPSQN